MSEHNIKCLEFERACNWQLTPEKYVCICESSSIVSAYRFHKKISKLKKFKDSNRKEHLRDA